MYTVHVQGGPLYYKKTGGGDWSKFKFLKWYLREFYSVCLEGLKKQKPIPEKVL